MPRLHPVVEKLSERTCLAYLAGQTLGRIAVSADDGVDIFPVNFFLRDGIIFFRSAPGAKLIRITQNPAVAFEIDGTNRTTSWSVVVKGSATRLGFDSEIEESGVLGLQSLSPTEKWNYVRINPASITGRRFRTQHRAAAPALAAVDAAHAL